MQWTVDQEEDPVGSNRISAFFNPSGARFSKVPVIFPALEAVLRLPCLHSRSKFL